MGKIVVTGCHQVTDVSCISCDSGFTVSVPRRSSVVVAQLLERGQLESVDLVDDEEFGHRGCLRTLALATALEHSDLTVAERLLADGEGHSPRSARKPLPRRRAAEYVQHTRGSLPGDRSYRCAVREHLREAQPCDSLLNGALTTVSAASWNAGPPWARSPASCVGPDPHLHLPR
jgi:hypothetical protein